jgi:hypothetical protein
MGVEIISFKHVGLKFMCSGVMGLRFMGFRAINLVSMVSGFASL